MPDDRQKFDIEKLKVDPRMWQRLAMPSENGDTLENVFKDKENPFGKNSKDAMDRVQTLAAEGKLYLREHGRSRHFHKVEKTENNLKLGEQHEMKLSNRTSDPILGGLMWLSRGYFKWIGLEKISNWFDRRLKQRSEIKELNNRYKEEYKDLTKEEKKELKAIRKHEKKLKALEQAKKEAEKTQQEIDKIRGIDTSKSKGEMDSPLNEPPKVEPQKNTMQPTLLGDQPVQEQKPGRQAGENIQIQTKVAQEEIVGTKKDAPQQKENNSQIFINGVELTDETANQFPPHIVDAFKHIQQMINEAEANKQADQQLVQEQPPVTEQPQVTEKDNQVTEDVPKQTNVMEQQENQTVEPKDAVKQNTADTQVPLEEVNAPLKDGADLEPEKVNIQQRHKDQAQKNLQERLAAEKEAMDAALNWKDSLANTLFSHEEGKAMRDQYQTINGNNKETGAEYLSGAVFGIFSKVTENPEQKQQVMDALLNGKPLGRENNDLINNGIAAYSDAFIQKTNGNPERLADMLANAMRELSHQASQETTLSPRLVTIGRLIGNAAKMANDNKLELPLTEDELDVVRGAAVLGDVARKYHDARQHLGKEPMDMSSKLGKRATRDLLMGNATEKMIQQDKRLGQTITSTQQLMGKGIWSIEGLRVYTASSATGRGIQQEDVQALLERPNSTKALDIGKRTANEIVQASMEDFNAAEAAMEKERAIEQQQEQPDIDPMNIMG